MRDAARRFRTTLATVQLWCRRASDRRLDRVDFSDRPSGNPHPIRTSLLLEDRILATRTFLKDSSAHGEFGAASIHRELITMGIEGIPSIRTIARILERRGAVDHKRRVRWPAPPRGWYLPAVAEKTAELDCFDFIEGLLIRGGPLIDVLNGISLHGGLTASWSNPGISALFTMEKLTQHWRQWGLPAYAQFDNDTRFVGPSNHVDVIGRVPRLCLSLGLTPVFAPPREPGFQNAVESFNERWVSKLWHRFHFSSHQDLCHHQQRFIAAIRDISAPRRDSAPLRAPFPKHWHLDLQASPSGKLIFIRRTNSSGSVFLLGREFHVSNHWPHRLVRAEVDLDQQRLRFFGLRRREPSDQRLLSELRYAPKVRTTFR